MAQEEGIELRWIMGMLRQWFWLIIGCALLATVIAYGVISLTPPDYESTATLLIGQTQANQASEYNTLIAGEQLAQTYSQMVKGQSVLQAVIAQLHLSDTPETLSRKITATPLSGTQLIRLSVKDKSPGQAALLANTIAETFISQIQSLHSERYESSLASMQVKIKSLSDNIDSTQASIDVSNARIVIIEQDLSQLENTLNRNRSRSQTVDQGLQSLKLSLVQLKNNVTVVEPAQITDNFGYEPFTAIVTLLVNKNSFNGNNSDDTFTQILEGRSIVDAAITKLGLSISPNELSKHITVTAVKNTQLIELRVLDKDREQARSLANTIAGLFISQVQELIEAPYIDQINTMQKESDDLTDQIKKNEADIDQLTAERNQIQTELSRLNLLLAESRNDYRSQVQDYEQLRLTATNVSDTIVVSEKAPVPERPNSNRLLYTLMAGAVGLLIGLGTAFVLAQMDDKVKSAEDISTKLCLNLLGSVLHFEKSKGELVTVSQPRSNASESFQVISTHLHLSTIHNPQKILIVTSPVASDGKSIVSANLAVTMAKEGLRVILVDADLRFPRIHQIFGVDQENGWTDALLQGGVKDTLKNTPVEKLKVLTSGNIPTNPTELVSSPKFTQLLTMLKSQSDILIIDSPPILPVADTSVLASISDGVLLVVRAEQTPSRAVNDAVDCLQKVGAFLAGVILNDVPERQDGYYGYYSYHKEKTSGNHSHPHSSRLSFRHLFKSQTASTFIKNRSKPKI